MAYRNTTKGARAIHLTNGSYVLVEPGATAEVADSMVRRVAPGLVKAKSALPSPPKDLAAKVKAKVATPKAKAGGLTMLRAAYKKALGKAPSPRWDAATLKAKIAAA